MSLGAPQGAQESNDYSSFNSPNPTAPIPTLRVPRAGSILASPRSRRRAIILDPQDALHPGGGTEAVFKKEGGRKKAPNHDLELGITLAAIVVIVLITMAGRYDLSMLF